MTGWRGVLALALACVAVEARPLPLSGNPAIDAAAAELRPGEFRWTDDPLAASSFGAPIVISVSVALQRLYVYRGGMLIGVTSVSTGKRGKATPLGDFNILQKRSWHRSNLYSNAPMPFMQRLTWSGIALHAGVNPGYPASHGCIRLPYAFAQRLFALTALGEAVVVSDYPAHTPVWLEVEWADADVSAPPTDAAPRLRYDPAVFAFR